LRTVENTHTVDFMSVQKRVGAGGAVAALTLVAAWTSADVAADAPAATPSIELPAFQPGMWEYRRTQLTVGRNKPQTTTVRKCSDPTSDIRKKLVDLEQRGCRFAPMSHSGNRYVMGWMCPTGNDRSVTFHDVLTVTSTQSYQDSSEAHQEQQVVHSEIVAIRIGKCPGPAVKE
jgi:Protein of unknown function (DUF3617)